jgi:predicted acetyltransferase
MPTISTTNTRNDTFLHAAERAQLVIDAINSNQPDALYSLLTEELRNAISQKEFMRMKTMHIMRLFSRI